MPKRANSTADLLAIGLFAPMVISARIQILGAEALRPTAKGRREAVRMVSEKPVALVHGALAAQKSLFDSGMKMWTDLALAGNAFALTAPALSMAAATAPVRRRVRRNAVRLTKG